MNRRGFLKGSAAMAAVPMAAKFSYEAISAQTPMYEGEVVYSFSEFAGAAYDYSLDGAVDAISASGLIVGTDRIDGRVMPCTWTLSGERTVLDVGALEFAGWRNLAVSPQGLVAGTLEVSADDSLLVTAITWASASPEVLPAGDTSATFARIINDAGTIAGRASGQAARWTTAGLETLVDPTAVALGSVALDSNDALYGMFFDGGFKVIGVPWRWNPDGSRDDLTWPDEIVNAAPEQIDALTSRVSAAFENGEYVLSATWRVGENWSSGSWINTEGSYRSIDSGGALADFVTMYALSPSRLFGFGPELAWAVWTDGTMSMLADVVRLPEGLGPSMNVEGITADGGVVVTAYDEIESPHIVVLRPV